MSQNAHIVCAGNYTLASIDFYKMLTQCNIPNCQVSSFGFKTPSLGWATSVMSAVRSQDPDARVLFDFAAELDAEECPGGPIYEENRDYAVLVKHNPGFALAQEWVHGTSSHYMMYPQIQAEILDFGQIPCFGTCLLTNPGKLTPLLMAIVKVKVYSTVHHYYKEHKKDFEGVTTAYTVKARLKKFGQIAHDIKSSTSRIRFEARFVVPENLSHPWSHYISDCKDTLKVCLLIFFFHLAQHDTKFGFFTNIASEFDQLL